MQLEEAFEPQLDRAEQMVWAALRAARLTEEFAPQEDVPSWPSSRGGRTSCAPWARTSWPGDVKYVVLAGGMSRIPAVARRLGELLPKAELHERVGDFLSDEVVVAGLADTVGYDKISLHRPAFDFVLEWDTGRAARMLYEAYTPLYDQVQVARGNTFLGHSWHARYPEVAARGLGRAAGALADRRRRCSWRSTARSMDGFQVRSARRAFSFKIYCGGQILISDGVGREHYDAGRHVAGRAGPRLRGEAAAHAGSRRSPTRWCPGTTTTPRTTGRSDNSFAAVATVRLPRPYASPWKATPSSFGPPIRCRPHREGTDLRPGVDHTR